MYKYIITTLLLCSLTSYAATNDVRLKSDYPERYTVVKGDTLWDISAKFLKDPWQWPKLWKMNRAEIKNPHRIYPGDVVVFDPTTGKLKLLRETITLEPGAVVESLDKEAIQSISPNIIAPFLKQPLVVDNSTLTKAPEILGGSDKRIAFSQGGTIFLDKVAEEDGRFWHIYRNGRDLIDPVTKEVLGLEAIHLGSAKVVQYGEPATAEVLQANQEIIKGDKLVAAPNESTDNYIPHAPESEIAGHLLSIYGGLGEAGRNSIVTINLGSSNGLEIGHVLAIYRDGGTVDNPKYDKNNAKPKEKEKLPEFNLDFKKASDGKWEVNAPKESKEPAPELDTSKIKLPDQRVGLLMVFRTFERVSYCLVVQASEPVHELDIVKTP